jgi:hypothetical protein
VLLRKAKKIKEERGGEERSEEERLHRNGAGWSSGTTTAGMIDQNKKVK